MTRKHTATFGTVSHGTLRTEDLIDTFAWEIRRMRGSLPPDMERDVKDCQARFATQCGLDDGFCEEVLDQMFDLMDTFAPPHAWFGASEGDGSDFGYWLSDDALQDSDALKVSDTSEVPKDYLGEVLHTNDHGNLTLYRATSRGMREIWSIV
jgi:hypothetical protein